MQAHPLYLIVQETSRHIAVGALQRVGLGDHSRLSFKLVVELNNDPCGAREFWGAHIRRRISRLFLRDRA
jgi:hypothetical protein